MSDEKVPKSEDADFSVETHVLEEIGALAAAEVEGVAGLSAGLGGRLISRGSGAVKATVQGDRIEIDVHLVADYEYPVKETARKVQAAVAAAVEAMVGSSVGDVNVFVDGVKFPSRRG